MITLPEQPWQEGDDFTVEETGVRYVYDGEKWLSESGTEADLSGFATKAFVDQVESASIFRDESIKTELEVKDAKQTAAILVVESDNKRYNEESRARDDKLQEQIDALAAGEIDLSPVEDRLDDIEDVLPREPIVVPPVDIGSGKILIDHPTRPSGADKPPAGECWMWHMDADRTGNPANEMKTTVPTEHQGNVILDGITAVWFKQGDRVQKWNTANGGWWTGGNLWHLSASSTEGDTLVDGQPFEIYYADPNTTGDNFTDVISREESKADDAELRVLIEGIEFPETDLAGYATEEWVTEEIGKIDIPEIPEIPEPVKSVISTQLMPRATMTYDMGQGNFTFRQRQGGSTLTPQLAFGIRYFPSTEDDWWKGTHEAIAGGYISVVDPAYGLVKWGGVVESVEEDGGGRLLFHVSSPFSNGDNLDSREYLVTLSGCLREK